jgi:hypothetical protein
MVCSKRLYKIAACALTLAACVSSIPEEEVSFAPGQAVEAPRLVVRSDYFGDLDIYAITGATRMRIGAVSTGRTVNFRLPRTLLTRLEIQFQIDPVGPVAPFTYRPIAFGPRNVIELSIAPTLQMSSYAIVVNQ